MADGGCWANPLVQMPDEQAAKCKGGSQASLARIPHSDSSRAVRSAPESMTRDIRNDVSSILRFLAATPALRPEQSQLLSLKHYAWEGKTRPPGLLVSLSLSCSVPAPCPGSLVISTRSWSSMLINCKQAQDAMASSAEEPLLQHPASGQSAGSTRGNSRAELVLHSSRDDVRRLTTLDMYIGHESDFFWCLLRFALYYVP